jgi:dCTP deaminase
MLLSYNELCELVRDGVIDADPRFINGASIDIRIGPELFIEVDQNPFDQFAVAPNSYPVIDLSDKNSELSMVRVVMSDQGCILPPGAFCLAHSVETFNLPDDIACEFRLRSSIARRGLNALLAMWCDPGWHGSQLTLELHNTLQHHAVLLKPDLRIGQMIFFRCETVPKERSYSTVGRYNHQSGVVASKGA